MASSWVQNINDGDQMLATISSALDHWFDRDFTEDDCINAGGQDNFNCPCGTPGFWNTNWYDQMILIPGLVGSACLLMKSNLSPKQFSNCSVQQFRAYVRIDGDPNGSMGAQTGANLLDASSIGMSYALLTSNLTLLAGAVDRIYNECQITEAHSFDGIKADGSYMQHDSQLYTGNYGKVFINNMLKIFKETSHTPLVPDISVQSAFLTLISGSEWFTYFKTKGDLSPILSWQYSVIGRMVSHKHADWHGIDLSLQNIIEATQSWENAPAFLEIVDRLNSTEENVNPGDLIGTRFFPRSDYMVHRGSNYIVTLKMFSSRTTNSECNNGQNPYGHHLSDGTLYNYIHGGEYTNVFGAWDWDLIPGTTVDYGANPLSCSDVQFKGKHSFVGGVAYGNCGIAVMNYTNPLSGSLAWTKTYFFFPNIYVVQFVGPVLSSSDKPVYTTLDQKQLNGPIYVDGEVFENNPNGSVLHTLASNIWHDGIAYIFQSPINITVDTRLKTSVWSDIGISEGNETQHQFTAYFENTMDNPHLTYIVYLNVNGGKEVAELTRTKGSKLHVASDMDQVQKADSAIVRENAYEENGQLVLGYAFITAGEYTPSHGQFSRIWTDQAALLLFQTNTSRGWILAVSDPSQKLSAIEVEVTFTEGDSAPRRLVIELPSGAYSGSSTIVQF